MPYENRWLHHDDHYRDDLGPYAVPANYRDKFESIQSRRDSDHLQRLNRRLDQLQLPQDVNEEIIDSLVQELDDHHGPSGRRYRLLTARLLEAALVCAGCYADNCEFSAAGDLLVNPRNVLIHAKNQFPPIMKQRHAALSQQFSHLAGEEKHPAQWLKKNVWVEISKPALLPMLLNRLERWDDFDPFYLASIRERLCKIGDTIGFLSAWSLGDARELHLRTKALPEEKRRFIHRNMCRFDADRFNRLGEDIDRLTHQTDYQSLFLIPCGPRAGNTTRRLADG